MRVIDFRKLIKQLALPLMFLAVVLTLKVIWVVFNLPPAEELIVIVKQYFDRYGYIALFISAIVESALVLGFYYPGGFVIFLSVILAGRDVIKVAAIVGIATAAFLIGFTFDYLLGKYGWYKLFLRLGFKDEMGRAEERLNKHGLRAIFLTYWQVNFASFTSTAAGTLHYPYFKFLVYSIPATLFWNSAWATLIYLVGVRSLDLVSGKGGYILAVFGTWTLIVLIKHIMSNLRSLDNPAESEPRI